MASCRAKCFDPAVQECSTDQTPQSRVQPAWLSSHALAMKGMNAYLHGLLSTGNVRFASVNDTLDSLELC